MNLILFGPPGAGKGTQAHLIKQRHELALIATGDILREEIKKKSSLGLEVEQVMAEGRFPSDEIILKIFEECLENVKEQGVILDGLPRTLNQAQKIDQIFKRVDRTVDIVIQISVDEDELIKRLSSRIVCKQCGTPYMEDSSFHPKGVCYECSGRDFIRRPDDEPEAIKTRLKVYNDQTKPLVEYYLNQGLLKVVDGMKPVAEVNAQIEALLGATQVLTRKSGCLYSAQDI
ncbi:MAG: adenylate kinase [Proteobacteria bacterium]|nr:adenylate kinase [Pseudomonadota bacterium]